MRDSVLLAAIGRPAGFTGLWLAGSAFRANGVYWDEELSWLITKHTHREREGVSDVERWKDSFSNHFTEKLSESQRERQRLKLTLCTTVLTAKDYSSSGVWQANTPHTVSYTETLNCPLYHTLWRVTKHWKVWQHLLYQSTSNHRCFIKQGSWQLSSILDPLSCPPAVGKYATTTS